MKEAEFVDEVHDKKWLYIYKKHVFNDDLQNEWNRNNKDNNKKVQNLDTKKKV